MKILSVVYCLLSVVVDHIYGSNLNKNTTEIITTSSFQVSDAKTGNNTETIITGNLTRITQPSINIKGLSDINYKKAEIQLEENNLKSEKFIPSPQLESYFEYNRFPVVPAYPEAKHVYSQLSSYIPPIPVHEKHHIALEKRGHASRTKSKEKENFNSNNSYLYLKHNDGTGDGLAGSTESNASGGDISTEKPQTSAQEKFLYHNGHDKPIRTENEFPSFKYYEHFNYGPSSLSNTLHPTPTPSYEWYHKFAYPSKSTPITVDGHPYPFITDMTKKDADPTIQAPKTFISEHSIGMNPWKRAAKIFATILPIGILISALTPNILTIGPANETSKQQCRKLANRAEHAGVDRKTVAMWSKEGCEARLLCETALQEDGMDAETVKQLFWTFVSQNAEDLDTPRELQNVSNAIRKKTCDQIQCRNITKRNKTLVTVK